MRLYTSAGTCETIKQCNELDIGLLMVDVWRNPDNWPFFAVDNGCYAAFNRKETWNPGPFLKILSRLKAEERRPDFVVIPDKPLSSEPLSFSETWLPVLKMMFSDFPMYLAVQDGMEPATSKSSLHNWMGY